MSIFRGAIRAAEDRNYDDRTGLSPIEDEVIEYCGQLPQDTHPTITVTPIVNTGRWLVPCPWCMSAQLASRNDHRFFCTECRNVGAEGKWVQVVWPESSEEIEALLSMRPVHRTQNWLSHETLGDLLAENETHGVR